MSNICLANLTIRSDPIRSDPISRAERETGKTKENSNNTILAVCWFFFQFDLLKSNHNVPFQQIKASSRECSRSQCTGKTLWFDMSWNSKMPVSYHLSSWKYSNGSSKYESVVSCRICLKIVPITICLRLLFTSHSFPLLPESSIPSLSTSFLRPSIDVDVSDLIGQRCWSSKLFLSSSSSFLLDRSTFHFSHIPRQPIIVSLVYKYTINSHYTTNQKMLLVYTSTLYCVPLTRLPTPTTNTWLLCLYCIEYRTTTSTLFKYLWLGLRGHPLRLEQYVPYYGSIVYLYFVSYLFVSFVWFDSIMLVLVLMFGVYLGGGWGEGEKKWDDNYYNCTMGWIYIYAQRLRFRLIHILILMSTVPFEENRIDPLRIS